MVKKVNRTRNAGTWTESQFESAIRSALRQKFKYWKAGNKAVERHSRPYTGSNKRRKIEVQCQRCFEWFPPSSIEKDHIIPVGSLKDPKTGRMTAQSLWDFLHRLVEEDPEKYQPLCRECHKLKTKEERHNKNNEEKKNTSSDP